MNPAANPRPTDDYVATYRSAIQAAQLLKSMSTAKVTPGSFPAMLAWAPTSNSSSSSSSGGSGGNDVSGASTCITCTKRDTAHACLLPPPPPLHMEKSTCSSGGAYDTKHDKEANEETCQFTDTRKKKK